MIVFLALLTVPVIGGVSTTPDPCIGQTALVGIDSPNAETDGRSGISVSGIPDVNGDGRGEVVVGAAWENSELIVYLGTKA
jgi:hypothetical protein